MTLMGTAGPGRGEWGAVSFVSLRLVTKTSESLGAFPAPPNLRGGEEPEMCLNSGMCPTGERFFKKEME